MLIKGPQIVIQNYPKSVWEPYVLSGYGSWYLMIHLSLSQTGSSSTNKILIDFQIQLKIHLVISSLISTWLLQNFVQTTTAALSWYVHNFVVIWSVFFELQWWQFLLNLVLKGNYAVGWMPSRTVYTGQLTEVRLSCYLVLLSFDSKTR